MDSADHSVSTYKLIGSPASAVGWWAVFALEGESEDYAEDPVACWVLCEVTSVFYEGTAVVYKRCVNEVCGMVVDEIGLSPAPDMRNFFRYRHESMPKYVRRGT